MVIETSEQMQTDIKFYVQQAADAGLSIMPMLDYFFEYLQTWELERIIATFRKNHPFDEKVEEYKVKKGI